MIDNTVQNYREIIQTNADMMYDSGVSLLTANKYFKDVSKYMAEIFDPKIVCHNTTFSPEELPMKIYYDLMDKFLRHYDIFVSENYSVNRSNVTMK